MPDKFQHSSDKDQKKTKPSRSVKTGKYPSPVLNGDKESLTPELPALPADEGEDFSETLYERMNLVVDRGQDPIRLDKFLTARIENISRNKVQQAIEGGRVLVNNRSASANYKIRPGDTIVCFSDRQSVGEEIIPEKMALNIFYEDDEVLVINKPPGLVVHPALGNYSGTLINGVAYYLQEKNRTISEETLPRFGLVQLCLGSCPSAEWGG